MGVDKLGEVLLENQWISEEELSRALRRQQQLERPLGEVLLELGFATAETVALGLSLQYEIPYIELDDEFILESEEVELVPEAMARRYCLIPLSKDDNDATMTVVMKDPLDLDALDTVRTLTGREVYKAVSTEEQIRNVIDKFYAVEAHIEHNLQEIVELETLSDSELGADIDADQLRIIANDAPVVRFVNLLLMQAVRDGASDIHFEPGEYDVTVRIRVDGVLREVTPPPKHLYQPIVTRIKILGAMDISERRLPLDGRFKFRQRDRTVDIRVSSLPEVHGEKLVLRVLDQVALVSDMMDLGFEAHILKRFRNILRLPHGIILLTGPTGSGKTTTLYTALSYLKTVERNIQTVEDPVEYLLPGINQMSIREKVGLDFARSLRSILRQDPDVIMVGEMRDLETARIAIRSALTGHLVLSTLHTNDTTSAFSRLRDVGIEPYLMAGTVRLVISQRLVRTLCPHCKEEAVPTDEQLEILTNRNPEAAGWTFYQGAGCKRCHNGYRGRTALLEFLEVNSTIRCLLEGGAGEIQLRNQAMVEGLESLVDNGLHKLKDGITSVDELLRVCPLVN